MDVWLICRTDWRLFRGLPVVGEITKLSPLANAFLQVHSVRAGGAAIGRDRLRL